MKRSRKVIFAFMATTAAVTLAGCGDDAPKPAEGLISNAMAFTSIEDCVEKGFGSNRCGTAQYESAKVNRATAPRFVNLDECERETDTSCHLEQFINSDGSMNIAYIPDMSGFMVADGGSDWSTGGSDTKPVPPTSSAAATTSSGSSSGHTSFIPLFLSHSSPGNYMPMDTVKAGFAGRNSDRAYTYMKPSTGRIGSTSGVKTWSLSGTSLSGGGSRIGSASGSSSYTTSKPSGSSSFFGSGSNVSSKAVSTGGFRSSGFSSGG